MEFKKRKIRSDRLSYFGERKGGKTAAIKESVKRVQGITKKVTSNIQSKNIRVFTPWRTVFLSAIVAFVMMFTAYKILHRVNIKNVVFLFGKDLQEDSYGHTNILLLGTGGDGHDGADLTDTIIIASINQATNQVTLLSVPRDLYVTDKRAGSTRINNLYFFGKNNLQSEQLGLDILKKHVEEITNIPINYYLKVDFRGFKEIVDTIGGIDIEIPEAVLDPMYPKGEDIGYETLSIPAGLQHLDGATALKYARSRHSTSDFSRSARQQLLLYAIKEKAEKEGILSDPSKLESLYGSLQSYLQTDLDTREIITLGKIGSQIKRENINTLSIHDDPTKCGGELYTPSRDLYNGASVLVPADKSYQDIHNLTDINLNHPEIRQSDVKIQILNGTKGIGLAAESKIILNRLCLNVIRFGNAQTKDVQTTTYYLKKPVPQPTLDALQELIPGVITSVVPQKYLDLPYASEADIVIELGADYLPRKMKDSFDGIVALPSSGPVTGEATPATSVTTPAAPTKTTTSPATTSSKPATPNKKK